MLCEVRGKKEKLPSQGNNCQTQSYHPFSFRQTPQAAMCPALGDAPRLVWASWDYPFLSPVISLWQWFSTQRVLNPHPPHTHTHRILAMLGGIWGHGNWEGATGIQWVEVRDAARPPAMPRQLPSQRTIWPQMSANEVEKQWSRNWRMAWLWTVKCDRNEVGEILESNFPP